MLAYVDCTFVAITYSDPGLCDCNRIIEDDLLPASPDIPDKQKELSIKADWKYTATTGFRLFPVEPAFLIQTTSRLTALLPEGYRRTLLRPPAC